MCSFSYLSDNVNVVNLILPLLKNKTDRFFYKIIQYEGESLPLTANPLFQPAFSGSVPPSGCPSGGLHPPFEYAPPSGLYF